jgi:thioesterase domain-containing protein
MAHRLAADAAPEGALVLIDAAAPGFAPPETLDAFDVLAALATEHGVEARAADLRPLGRRAALEAITERAQQAGHGLLGTAASLERLLTVCEAAISAAARYAPPALPGAATLVRASDDPTGLSGRDPTYGWRALIQGPLAVEVVPGDHRSIVRAPFARATAAAIRAAIARSEAAS